MSRVADVGERALIERIRALVPAPPSSVIVGIGDDAAVVEPERNRLDVLTTDALVEGVHFDRRFASPDDIGFKALAVNLSDLAAMGAAPRLALLSLAIPDDTPALEVESLVRAFVQLATLHKVALIGGNIARSPGPIVVTVTAIGSVKRRRVLGRGGAKPGDDLYLSGSIGSAAAGLEWLRRAADEEPEGVSSIALPADGEPLASRYRRPEPRVRLGLLLGRNRAASACIDLSDGLADALHQLAKASDAGVRIDPESVPIDPAARRWFESARRDPLQAALRGGEDYELLFAVPRRSRRRFEAVRRLVGQLPVTRIGIVTADRSVVLHREGGDEPIPGGFAHFQKA